MGLKLGKILKVSALCVGLMAPHMTASAMTASQSVSVERSIKLADGSVQTKYEAPEKVVPGDRLVYTVNYLNDKDVVTEGFRLAMPVPEQLTYIEGSADMEDANVAFSIDGGESYKSRSELVVTDADGNRRAATAEDITHIRWKLTKDVQPGEAGEIKFKGKLK